MKLGRLLASLVVPLMLLACGKGTGSPGGPVEPSPPNLNADIVATSSLTFGLCTGPGAGCFYSQEYNNAGSGCANNLHGKIRAYEGDTLLETDDWWLESSFVIQPGESTLVEDCCFDQETERRRTRTVAETFWNNVSCS